MLENPWVIWCHMVRHKIQNQAQSALHKHLPCSRESLRSAKMFIHDVPVYTVSRTDIIGRGIVWQCTLEISLQGRIFVCNAHSLWASFPYTHQPYGIHTERGNNIPLLCWNTA